MTTDCWISCAFFPYVWRRFFFQLLTFDLFQVNDGKYPTRTFIFFFIFHSLIEIPQLRYLEIVLACYCVFSHDRILWFECIQNVFDTRILCRFLVSSLKIFICFFLDLTHRYINIVFRALIDQDISNVTRRSISYQYDVSCRLQLYYEFGSIIFPSRSVYLKGKKRGLSSRSRAPNIRTSIHSSYHPR